MSLTEWPDLTPALVEQLPGLYGQHGPLTVDRLKISESATFKVVGLLPNAQPAVVRVYRTGRHSPEVIASELAWVTALHDSGIATPDLIPARSGHPYALVACPDGAERVCAVFEYVPPDVEEPALAEYYFALGALTAQLQLHAREWAVPAGFTRPSWDVEATMSATNVWGQWPAMELSPHDRLVLERARDKVLAELPPFDTGHVQLLHADFKPANSIWSEGRLFVIDFDDAGFAWPLFDLAAALSFLEDAPLLSGLAEQWLRGYRTLIEPSAEERASIPALVMQRRLMLLSWVSAHPDAEVGHSLAEMLRGTLSVAAKYLEGRLLPTLTRALT